MEREIKFKFWNNETKTMSCSWSIWDLEYEWFPEEYNYENWKVLQFTGLQDKNWKEIYEGSLLWEIPNAFADPTIYEVVYHKEWFYLRNTFTNTIAINKRLSNQLIELEIKWDIYSNPELLNK